MGALFPWILLLATAAQPTERVLYVQQLGNCGAAEQGTTQVVDALKAFFPIEVRQLPCADLPAKAFYKPRQRYRAERLLEFLAGRMPSDGWRILGLTSVDISTTKGKVADWGILGLGELPGSTSVISSFRCRKTARNKTHAIERLAKVAVHEIGHTLGLPHCPELACLMEDANGKVGTVDRERDFCQRCRQLAARNHNPIRDNVPIGW
jgi:archaemetzincin